MRVEPGRGLLLSDTGQVTPLGFLGSSPIRVDDKNLLATPKARAPIWLSHTPFPQTRTTPGLQEHLNKVQRKEALQLHIFDEFFPQKTSVPSTSCQQQHVDAEGR